MKMARQKDNGGLIKATIVEQLGLTARWGLGCGAIVAFFHYLAAIVASLAGQTTNASIILSFLAQAEVNQWLAWGLAAGGVVYGNSQRTLRRRVITEQHDYIVALERKFDRRRSSSQLTKDGDTNPVDK